MSVNVSDTAGEERPCVCCGKYYSPWELDADFYYCSDCSSWMRGIKYEKTGSLGDTIDRMLKKNFSGRGG